MNTPWSNQTGLARTATITVTVLLIALGLCGTNYAMVAVTGDKILPLLIVTGVLELAVMGICFLMLLVLGVIALFQAIQGTGQSKK